MVFEGNELKIPHTHAKTEIKAMNLLGYKSDVSRKKKDCPELCRQTPGLVALHGGCFEHWERRKGFMRM